MSHYTSIISFKTRALSSVVVHTSFTLLAIITLPSRYTHLLSTLSKSLHFEAERVWTWFIDSEDTCHISSHTGGTTGGTHVLRDGPEKFTRVHMYVLKVGGYPGARYLVTLVKQIQYIYYFYFYFLYVATYYTVQFKALTGVPVHPTIYNYYFYNFVPSTKQGTRVYHTTCTTVVHVVRWYSLLFKV
jgi:hypothetical protein